MKGVILCAGKGTRIQPFSYSQPKTLIPVLNKPVLEYCIENLVKQGIIEIGIVINDSQQVIVDFVGHGEQYGANVQYIYQMEQKGISHAIKQAEQFVGNEPFIVLLGDNLIAEDLKVLIDAYKSNTNHASIMLASVHNPQDYGVATINGQHIVSLEEKPRNPKSNLAVVGVYIFDSTIFQAINNIHLSSRKEYEITDAIQWMLNHGKSISYTITDKLFSDVGTIERWLEANVWMMKSKWDDQIKVGKHTTLENCTMKGPVIIGEHCVLKNAEIGPYVSIHDECRIDNCQINHSILLEKSIVMNVKEPISQSIIGREVKINGIGPMKNKHLTFILGDKSTFNSED